MKLNRITIIKVIAIFAYTLIAIDIKAFATWNNENTPELNKDITKTKYNKDIYNNMKSIYLCKNIIDGKNVLTQHMIEKTNTRYIIQHDYDLQDKTIIIPKGCVLDFQKGSLKNGCIKGNITKISYNNPIFSNIKIEGTWNIEVIHSWIFKDITIDNKLRNLFKLCSDNYHNKVFIHPIGKPYIIEPVNNFEYCGINIPSNTYVSITGSIKIKANSYPKYSIFNIITNNVTIEGGEFIGDANEHKYVEIEQKSYSSHEWGIGIRCRNANNVIIKNVKTHNFTGDGIILSGTNVSVYGLISYDNRRQGITIGNLFNSSIKNFEIYNINGTNPKAGIDFEPDSGKCHNVIIQNGYIHDSYQGVQIYQNKNSNINGIILKNLTMRNVGIGVNIIGGSNVSMNNIDIRETFLIKGASALTVSNKTSNIVADKLYIDCHSNQNEKTNMCLRLQCDSANGMRISNSTFIAKNCGYWVNVDFFNSKFIGDKTAKTDWYDTYTGNNYVNYNNCQFKGAVYICENNSSFQDCEFIANENLDYNFTTLVKTRGNRYNLIFNRCKFHVPYDTYKYIMSIANSSCIITNSQFYGLISKSAIYSNINVKLQGKNNIFNIPKTTSNYYRTHGAKGINIIDTNCSTP